MTIQELEVDSVAFLILANGLHFEGMCSTNAIKLTNRAGNFIQNDNARDEPFMIQNYLRFRVDIDVNSPLTFDCLVPRKTLALQNINSNIWIEFKYEKIPYFCIKCGILDYITDEKHLRIAIQFKINDSTLIPMIGEWLKASF